MQVTVKTPGAMVTGHNGTFDCTAISLASYGGSDEASISAVGKSGKELNAGMWAVPAKAIDEMCLDWLRQRGLLPAEDQQPEA